MADYLAPTGLPYLSVSQVETAFGEVGCEYKWGQRYLARNKPPRDGSADLGSRVHEINEKYMESGTEPNLDETLTFFHKRRELNITYHPGLIWASGRHFLPPRKGTKCEGHFRFATSIHGRPVWWQGAKDMEWLDPNGLWHIGDLKTTVSWTYQKTADKLRRDWQGNLYAYELMQRLNVQAVQLDWFTYCTDPEKPRECRPTSIVVLWPEVLKIVSEIEEKGRTLLSHYQHPEVFSTLPKNRSACPAYGGCPYRDTPACPTPSLEELFMPADNVYQDFLTSIKSRQGIVPATPPPPWTPGDPLNEAQEFLKGKQAPLSAIANAADVPPSPEVAATYTAPPIPESGFVNPPEAQGLRAPVTPEELEAAPVTSVPQQPPPLDDLDNLTRDELKARGVALGVVEPDSRWQAPRIRDAVRAKLKSETLTKPPPPPPPVVVAPEVVPVSLSQLRQIVREELRVLLAEKVKEMQPHLDQR